MLPYIVATDVLLPPPRLVLPTAVPRRCTTANMDIDMDVDYDASASVDAAVQQPVQVRRPNALHEPDRV